MISEKNKQELRAQYDKMNSPESWQYTEEVLLAMGKKIQQEFPGVDFILKARGKSIESHEGKISRLDNSNDSDGKQIYDNHGFRLIIKDVADDFKFEHALCKLNVAQRIKIALDIRNEKSSIKLINKKYEKFLDNYDELGGSTELEQAIKELEQSKSQNIQLLNTLKRTLKKLKMQEIMITELHKELESKDSKILKMGKNYYEFTNDYINSMMATHIMNSITKDKSFMKSLGLRILPWRKKFHAGGKSGYYRAYHDSLGSTRKGFEWWKLELQALSYSDYLVSKDGSAKHSNCEGKRRVLPKLGETKADKEYFKKKVLRRVPKNLVYQNGIYKDGKEIKPGTVYKCSDVENMVYYYLEVLKDAPDFFEDLISDTSLFSDKENEPVER